MVNILNSNGNKLTAYMHTFLGEPEYRGAAATDRINLQPAYDRVNTAVREVDDEVLIFFAGVTWGDTGAGMRGRRLSGIGIQ